MRFVVVSPSISDFYFTQRRHTSLGARLLCDTLEALGHEAILVDFPATAQKPRRITLPAELSYLEDFIVEDEYGPTSFFRYYQRLGPAPHEQANAVARLVPDAVMISSFAFAYADDAIAFARELHDLLPGLPIVAGGPGPTVHPDYYLGVPIVEPEEPAETGISSVACGPAEVVAPIVLDSLEHDSLPSVLSAQPATGADVRFAAALVNGVLTTSVTCGCPRRCRFCSIHLTHGSRFATIDPSSFAHGLETFADSAVEAVNFEDDNLVADTAFLEEILSVVARTFPGRELRAENGLDPGFLNPALVDRLAKAGFRHLNLSMGSYDPSALEAESRHLTGAIIPEITECAGRLGLSSTVFWICGLATDTCESVIETLDFVSRLPAASGISLFYPVPGLAGFTDRSRFPRGAALRAKGSSAFPWNESLSTRQMITAFRLSRFLSVLSLPKPDGLARDIIDRSRTTRTLHTLRRGKRGHPVPVPELDESLVARFFARIDRVRQ